MDERTEPAERAHPADGAVGQDHHARRANQATPAVAITSAGAQQAAPRVLRHEVEPTVRYAVVPGPARDTVLFYHLDASSRDLYGLWASCRFCLSNLVWVHDHFVVTPNPLYLNPLVDPEERFAKVARVLLNWYDAKRLVASLDWPAE